MNNFCVAINLPNPCTKPVEDYGTDPHVFVPLTDISPEFMSILNSRGLDLLLAELFYNPPRKISKIHVDALGGNYSKINFVYGGKKSLMCWYTINDGVPKRDEVDYTSIDTRSYNYSLEEVTLRHRQTLHSPSIVQVGIPHNIINAFEPRWCLSLVIVNNKSRRRVSMQDTLKIFHDLLLDGAPNR